MAQTKPDKLYWLRDGVVESRTYEQNRMYTHQEAARDLKKGSITLPIYIYEEYENPKLSEWWVVKENEGMLVSGLEKKDIPPEILLYRLLEVPDENT